MSEKTTELIESSNRAELNAYLAFKEKTLEKGNLSNFFFESSSLYPFRYNIQKSFN